MNDRNDLLALLLDAFDDVPVTDDERATLTGLCEREPDVAETLTYLICRTRDVLAEQRPSAPRLERVDPMHAGGTVAYSVTLAGRWVGWVGDGREWRGHRYGGRRWWACWRQDGDTAARWSTDLDYTSRAGALAALVERIACS